MRIHTAQIRNKGLSITIHWSTPQLPEDHQEFRSLVIDAVADGGECFTVRDAKNSGSTDDDGTGEDVFAARKCGPFDVIR